MKLDIAKTVSRFIKTMTRHSLLNTALTVNKSVVLFI